MRNLRSAPGIATVALAALLAGTGCDGLFGPRWGETVWFFSFDSTASLFESSDITAAPALGSDGTIYVGLTQRGWWPFPWISWEGGRLFALTPDGRRQWSSGTEAGIGGIAVGADGTVYVSAGGKLVAFGRDGTERWSFDADTAAVFPPAIGADGTVFAACDDGYLYALNPDGTQRWRLAVRAPVNGPPVISADGSISVPTRHGLVRTAGPDGRLLWDFLTPARSTGIVAVGNQGTLYVGTSDNRLYIVSPGGTRFRTVRLDGVATPGVVDPAGNCVFGLAESNEVLCVSELGEVQWRTTTKWPSRRAPAAGTDSAFYFVCMQQVHCFGPDGRERWSSRIMDVPGAAPLIRPDGLLLVADRAALRAVTTPTSGLAGSAWPASRGDIHNTGRAGR